LKFKQEMKGVCIQECVKTRLQAGPVTGHDFSRVAKAPQKRFGFSRGGSAMAESKYRRGYSGSPIAILRIHAAEWLFPQEKATL
jgi:hypothetical protein